MAEGAAEKERERERGKVRASDAYGKKEFTFRYDEWVEAGGQAREEVLDETRQEESDGKRERKNEKAEFIVFRLSSLTSAPALH